MHTRSSKNTSALWYIKHILPIPVILHFTMAMKSSTYYQQTESDLSQYDQTTDIGDGRSIIVSVLRKSVKFARPGKADFVLFSKPSKILDMNMEEIRRAVQSFKANELTETFSIPLGRRYFITISPEVRCVSFRRFYRPKHDNSLMLPGSQGLGLKFSEFETLLAEWNDMRKSLDVEDVEICQNEHSDESCQHCFH